MVLLKQIIFAGLVISLLGGCYSATQDRVEKLLQTDAANIIKNDYKSVVKQLVAFKDKLDKRNPKAYSKTNAPIIYTQLDNLQNTFNLKYANNDLVKYKEYLQIAFSKSEVENRNDYLVLGLYKLVYDAYDIGSGHQMTAFGYDENKLQRLYQNLQILKWKLKTARDLNNEYLFLTWQNNWQVELEKRVQRGEKLSYEELQNLEYIKNDKETLFSASNNSFEILLTVMAVRVKNTLETMGVEPTDLGIEAVKSIFLFL